MEAANASSRVLVVLLSLLLLGWGTFANFNIAYAVDDERDDDERDDDERDDDERDDDEILHTSQECRGDNKFLLDFESGLEHGSQQAAIQRYLSSVGPAHFEIVYSADSNGAVNNPGGIYDSRNNGGADPDLEDPAPNPPTVGNMLIIQENNLQSGNLWSNPDDEADGGKHFLAFQDDQGHPVGVDVLSWRNIDFDDDEDNEVTAKFLEAPNLTIQMTSTDNDAHGLQIPDGFTNVKKIIYDIGSSGAITDICIHIPEETETTEDESVEECGINSPETPILESFVKYSDGIYKATFDNLDEASQAFTINIGDEKTFTSSTEDNPSCSVTLDLNDDNLVWEYKGPHGTTKTGTATATSILSSPDDDDDEPVDHSKVLVCHFPPGNLWNFHEKMIPPSALRGHIVNHGDKLGQCSDKEEEKITKIKVKKQREEIRDKNELKEKRSELKEIKKDLKDLKKFYSDEEKKRIKTLVEDIKEVIKKLKENSDYDKEHKKIIKAELKDIKREIINEIKSDGKISKYKVDSKITKLSKSDNPKHTAKKLGLDFENGKTQIVIQLSGKDPAVVEQLRSIGKIDAKDDKHVQLTVNLSDLPKLRTIGGIENIRPPFSAVQFEEALSEGVYFINADLAQFTGITGQGIKVAVLDLAFTDNPKISDNIVQVKSFRQGIGYLPIQGNEDEASHGTAVAEIISDVAPDVQLYLYSMETDIEFVAAVDEAISQQVDIIVMSAGWPNFPTDGSSHITKKIEHVVDNGITFVVPAGNFANKHWEGNFADSNFNNWHEFSKSDEGLTIEVTEERITEEKPIVAHLMWDVGMSDVADFELVLVSPLGQIVDYSANEQTSKSDTPFEYIYHIPDVDGIYSIGILFAGDMSSTSERPSASLEIFSVNDNLEYPISKSSVSVPADAQGAIVVGAVNHLDGTLESFSSQGPTNNGKLAPHVVGPDGVTTLALDGNPFYGTSATAPYVAGLAALIIQTHPDITPHQLLNEIQQNTDSSLFSLQNEFDYAFGYGSASATFLIEELEVLE